MNSLEEKLKDPRAIRVLGFFVAKGLLIGRKILPKGNVKLNLKDVYWVGNHVEPRVFEVLPAAMLHFPKTFIGGAHAPAELLEVIRAIQLGEKNGPDFMGMRFRDMRKWANHKTKDKRTKPLSQIKRNKTLRLSPKALAALEEKSKKAGVSQTYFLEMLLTGSTFS